MVPIPLAPLKEFEVVLHLTLDELLNINWSIDAMACEAGLQDLKILQVCVFGIDIKFDSGHRDIKVNAVEDLAESRTSSALLNLGYI